MYELQTNKSLPQSKKRKNQKYTIEAGEYELCVFGRTGQRVGKLSGNTAYKDVSAETAFLKFPYPAIAHTIAALEYMRDMNITYIDVYDKDSGIHYRTTVQKYFDEGEYFFGGVRWGDQLKLALPKFTQTRDPEFAQSQTEPQEYSEPTETNAIMPLEYKSHATVGIVRNGVQQLDLFKGE